MNILTGTRRGLTLIFLGWLLTACATTSEFDFARASYEPDLKAFQDNHGPPFESLDYMVEDPVHRLDIFRHGMAGRNSWPKKMHDRVGL